MSLDSDAVLWALRGMPRHARGVSADEVARFLSKDATLTELYSRDDVVAALESLVETGELAHEPTTGEEPQPDESVTHYRLVQGAESPMLAGDALPWAASVDNEWSSFLTEESDPADAVTSVDDASTVVANLEARIDELERERATLAEACDGLRECTDAAIGRAGAAEKRAETAERRVANLDVQTEELRSQIRELEDLLREERALNSERSDSARRAAAALAHARRELDGAERRTESERATTHMRPRPVLRGNWLR